MQPKYLRYKAQIVEGIFTGQYAVGTELPSERDLAICCDVSRDSIRHALKLLEEEGFIMKSSSGRHIIAGLCPNKNNDRILFYGGRSNLMTGVYRMVYDALLIKSSLYDISICNVNLLEDVEKHSGTSDFKALLSIYLDIPEDIAARAGKVIILDEHDDDLEYSVVSTDNYEGGRMAAAHLYECGCRHPVCLSLPWCGYRPFLKRVKGFTDFFAEAGIRVDEVELRGTSLRNVKAVLLGHDAFTKWDGMFVMYDYLAANILYTMKELGIKVPDDIQIVSFDGLRMAEYLVPGVTSVAQPINAIAEKALEIAMADSCEKVKVLLKPQLIVRESTCCRPKV